jgi:DNA polymerase V
VKAIVDCNSFYCSCERLFRPDLWSRPVVVLSNNDGCIVSRTDEAKRLGIAMAGPYYQAKPVIEKFGVEVFSSNYNLYGDLSWRVMETLRMLVGKERVEVYSVDECFLDLSQTPPDILHPVASELKEVTEMWTGIKVSIGVAPTKVLCKVANRLAKKDKPGTRGVVVLDTPEKINRALEKTPVDDVWGVGRRYAEKLHSYSIDNALQLRGMSEEWARKNLGGVTGVRLIKELRGEACIEMKDPLETKKMIATTRMFGKPVSELKELREAVATYTARAAEKLRRQGSATSFIDVFLVTNDYDNQAYTYNPRTRHRYTTLPYATSVTTDLIQHALPLVDALYAPGSKYLKAGITLGSIIPDDSIQGNLFAPPAQQQQKILMQVMDNINFSMRDDALKFVASGLDRNWKMRQELRSRKFTTRWDELFEVK